MHLEVGVFLQPVKPHQYPSKPKLFAFFRATIASLLPSGSNNGLDLFSGGPPTYRRPQIDAFLRIET
jgi:hypothetical protein